MPRNDMQRTGATDEVAGRRGCSNIEERM